MIRKLALCARSTAIALGILSSLSLTGAPMFGANGAQAGERYWRDGYRCPRIGDCDDYGSRGYDEERLRYRDRSDDHADWSRNNRRYYAERRDYGPSPSIYFDFSVPVYRSAPPVYVAPRSSALSGAHVDWCYDRYRSYRAYDNTYQPYGAPRQQCWSPYR